MSPTDDEGSAPRPRPESPDEGPQSPTQTHKSGHLALRQFAAQNRRQLNSSGESSSSSAPSGTESTYTQTSQQSADTDWSTSTKHSAGEPKPVLKDTIAEDEDTEIDPFQLEDLDDGIGREWEIYNPGNYLTITSYTPPGPYPAPFYPLPEGIDINKLSFDDYDDQRTRTEDAYAYTPTGFKKPSEREATLLDYPYTDFIRPVKETQTGRSMVLRLRIMKRLSGGLDSGPQVLKCKVDMCSSPMRCPMSLVTADYVALKVFDPMFSPWVVPHEEGPWSDIAFTDMCLSREVSAYQELSDKPDLAGHLAPKYYGAYAVSLKTTNTQVENRPSRRYAGAVLLEYVPGHRMSDLCPPDDDGILRLPPHSETAAFMGVRLDEGSRLELLKQFLDGFVRQLHAGVDQACIDPEDLLVVPGEGSRPARVFLVNYRRSVVDSKLTEPKGLYKDYKLPPLPFDEVALSKVESLMGWIPATWDEDKFDSWLAKSFNELDYTTGQSWDEFKNPSKGKKGKGKKKSKGKKKGKGKQH